MKKSICIICSLSLILTVSAQPAYKLWYDKPANAAAKDTADGWTNDPAWLYALPLGNGYLGAMVFGGVNRERIQLNEKSLWSGSPDDNDNPQAAAAIPQIRDLLFAGKFREATELTNKTQVCKGVGSGQGNGAKVPFGCFQTLGDLRIDFGKKSPYRHYYRELDLNKGIALVSYTQNGIRFRREMFISYPDRALVIRLSADKPASLSFILKLDRPERFSTTASGSGLVMQGTLDNGKGGEGMKYKAEVVPVISGGTIKASGQSLAVSKATEVVLIITAATNYRLHYPDYTNDRYEAELEATTHSAIQKSYTSLRERHVQDFSSFMLRSYIDLGDKENTGIPTDSLMHKNAVTQKEPWLHALYYQYGRYLLLSSSRKGSLPANLQGIWANKIQTPWNGDYHTDINVQMNYWPAEVANLPECHEQLTDLIESVVVPSERTAKVQYNLDGWVIHPITNVWGYTAPGEHPGWGMHIGAGAWLCQHLWQHFAFTRDTAFLKKTWPVLKSSCRFYLAWLVRDPVSGKWVSGPATSPENAFIAPDGYQAQMSMGPSHDQELIHELFSNTLMAAGILNDPEDKSFADSIASVRAELAKPGIAADGRLMEWAKEYKEAEPHHRHTSHLYALYPGDEISLDKTPELAAAARKSLEGRGDGGNGWSLAWKISFWARLKEGDHALKLLNALLKPISIMGTIYDNGGGSYLNLFDACPPFQIDGNFGATAGIAEMLLQSHQDDIEILPALPGLWKTGKAKGLCARGGFKLDMEWKDGKLNSLFLLSGKGGEARIKYAGKTVSINTIAGKRYVISGLTGTK